jgi:hypothetical protein
MELPYDPPLPVSYIYPKESKSAYNTDTCTPMLTAEQFTIAKSWNQPWCPLTDEWTKKMKHTHTHTHTHTKWSHKEEQKYIKNGAIKKNKSTSFAGK